MNDALGKPITVGCEVAYATTLGRSPVLKFGTVSKITRSGVTIAGGGTLPYGGRILILKEAGVCQ